VRNVFFTELARIFHENALAASLFAKASTRQAAQSRTASGICDKRVPSFVVVVAVTPGRKFMKYPGKRVPSFVVVVAVTPGREFMKYPG
jgi:hypothetical protein